MVFYFIYNSIIRKIRYSTIRCVLCCGVIRTARNHDPMFEGRTFLLFFVRRFLVCAILVLSGSSLIFLFCSPFFLVEALAPSCDCSFYRFSGITYRHEYTGGSSEARPIKQQKGIAALIFMTSQLLPLLASFFLSILCTPSLLHSSTTFLFASANLFFYFCHESICKTTVIANAFSNKLTIK